MGRCLFCKYPERAKLPILVGLLCTTVYLYIRMTTPDATLNIPSRNRITARSVVNASASSKTKQSKHSSLYYKNIKGDTRTMIQEQTNTSKVRHIGFLKVHKAASSTMQNMFFRFGLKHGLTFVLPVKNNYLIPGIGVMPARNGHHFDILAIHSNYSKELYASLLPVDSVNIGIVREPLERMISAAYYYKYKFHRKYLQKIPDKTFIQSLVNNPDKFETKPFSYTKNAMGMDFGFSSKITESDTTEIDAHLGLLKKEFRLVLLSDLFEESLVLMKRYLNWGLTDILFLQANKNTHNFVDKRKLNMKKFRNTCFLDYIIYNTFSEILREKIAKEDESFPKEVAHFKNVLNKVYLYCVGLKKDVQKLVVPRSKWSERFEIDKDDCRMMGKTENDILAGLRQRHQVMNQPAIQASH